MELSKHEIYLILEWYKYVIINEDVPVHQDNMDLAYKLEKERRKRVVMHV